MVMKNVICGLGVLALALIVPLTASAELSEDTHLTRDDHLRLDIDPTTFNEFKGYYDAGYPPASIMLQGISLGMSIEDVVYLAVKADPGRGREFYDTAVNLLPSLPGWACRTGSVPDRYAGFYTLDQLGTQNSIISVANAWFDNNRQLTPFPDWKQGRAHMNASVSELASLLNGQKFWYRSGGAHASSLFVSLYKDSNEVVIDGGVEAIRRAQQAGEATLPVVIVYNQGHQRPLSRYSPDVTVSEIAHDFFENRVEITPVPEWKEGDFHLSANIGELQSLLHASNGKEISPGEMAAAEQKIKNNAGMVKDPLLLTLLRTGGGTAWIDRPATLEAAESMGISKVPVTLFYEDIDRQACGVPSSCRELICDAAIAAGGMPQMCESGNNVSALRLIPSPVLAPLHPAKL